MRFSKEISNYYYSNIQLNEGAYFFRSVVNLTKRFIKNDIFDNVEKDTPRLAEEIQVQERMQNGNTVLCSLLLFNKTVDSGLLPANVFQDHTLTEKRIGYLVIIEIGHYIIIIKKNVSGISKWLNSLACIGGFELTSALADSNTILSQAKLTNMSMNPDALRNRSYEGNDLFNSMPLYGLNRNILKAARFRAAGNITSVNLGTARVNQFEKKNIHDLCEWASDVIDKIDHPNNLNGTIFDSFAQSVSWKSKKDNIMPKSLLIDVHSFTNLRQIFGLRLIYKQDNGIDLTRHFDWIVNQLNNCFSLSNTSENIYVCDNTHNTLEVITSSTGIYLRAKGILTDLFVIDNTNTKRGIISFINSHRCFVVGFQQPEYIYYGHQLHEDKKLLNNLGAILSVLQPINGMDGVTSEKGNVYCAGQDFEKNSVFYVVEEYFKKNNASNIICDDLGNEWADHLVTCGDTLYFVHSKAKGHGTSLSASNFQDVIAQALKNIGNMNSDKIDNKRNSFLGYYSTTTKSKCRLGTVDGFISEYKRINQSPNGRQEVCIAVDFVSKQKLTQIFKDKNYIRSQNNVVQLIWLLYSFISSCKDAGMGCKIFCKQ